MATAELPGWLDQFLSLDRIWYVKRLSANDTLANNTHKAGPYINKQFLIRVFPDLERPGPLNRDHLFQLHIDSHPDVRTVRVVLDNNRFQPPPSGEQRVHPRDEARLTRLGGATSALLDPENTGALAVFAFQLPSAQQVTDCHFWVCRDCAEEDLIENRIGPVEPGKALIWSAR